VLNRLLIFTDSTKENTRHDIPIEVSAKYTDVSVDENIKVLLQETVKQAAYNSTTRYATGCMDVNSTIPLFYSLAQCNSDLPPSDCWDCLDNITSTVKNFFYLQRGEWIAGVWCNFRYDTYQFYEGQPMQHIAWSATIDQTNMTGPVGVPRQKDENESVDMARQKYKSKQDSRFFLLPKTRWPSFLVVPKSIALSLSIYASVCPFRLFLTHLYYTNIGYIAASL
jgi:hypothetical protein